MNLDIDYAKLLRVGVDLDQSGVRRLVELSKARDETDGTLLDRLVRVGAAVIKD